MEKNAAGNDPRPMVGIGIVILNKEGEVLLGLRQGSHGAGQWGLPGGHLEFGETIFETSKREVEEETGLVVNDLELISVYDDMQFVKTDNKHYLDLGVKAAYAGGEPQLLEPDKCKEWAWFPIDALPENILGATIVVINNFRSGKIYQPHVKK